MTDNEIIKALENCMTPNNVCGDCSFRKECDNNPRTLENYALDLINRQKAEIERLTGTRDTCPMDFCGILCRYSEELIAKAKTEAYNELAERLKEEVAHIPAWGRVAEKKIDNLLKEMFRR